MAMVLAGPTDLPSFLMAFVWFELHLLAFEASNSANREDVSLLTYNRADQEPSAFNFSFLTDDVDFSG
jgi:hypothetical protein